MSKWTVHEPCMGEKNEYRILFSKSRRTNLLQWQINISSSGLGEIHCEDEKVNKLFRIM